MKVTLAYILFLTVTSSVLSQSCDNDGVCENGETALSCLNDCWQFNCSENARINRPLNGGMPLSDDTIGNLVNNQLMWRLPGIDHLRHGYDMFTGTESISPIFAFHYCDENRIIQDSYRGYTYQLPLEVTATTYPKCDFSSKTQFFSSSQQHAKAKSQSQSLTASVEASGKVLGVHAKLAASLSLEDTVSTSRETQSKRSGQISVTEATCFTSKIEVDVVDRFSQSFVTAIKKTGNINCDELIQRFGTHYYKRATMGGRLTQIGSTSDDHFFSKSKSEHEQSLSAGLSASASGWGYSGSAAVEYSGSRSDNEESQNDFESKTTKSDVITHGGIPGSFGPDGDSGTAPTTWNDWASSVDTLPIPIEFETDLIYNILPENIKDCWVKSFEKHINSSYDKFDRGTEYEVIVTMKKTTSTLAYGPFAFSLTGETILELTPFYNESVSPPQPQMFFADGSTYSFRLRGDLLGDIKSIRISDYRNYNPDYGLGDTPDGWPVDRIEVVDWTNGREFVFANLFLETESCIPTGCTIVPSNAVKRCFPDGNCIIPVSNLTNTLKVKIDFENFSFYRHIPFRIVFHGEKGTFSTKPITEYPNHPATSKIYWFNVDKTIGAIQKVEISSVEVYPEDYARLEKTGSRCTSPPFKGYKSYANCTSNRRWKYTNTPTKQINLDSDIYIGADNVESLQSVSFSQNSEIILAIWDNFGGRYAQFAAETIRDPTCLNATSKPLTVRVLNYLDDRAIAALPLNGAVSLNHSSVIGLFRPGGACSELPTPPIFLPKNAVPFESCIIPYFSNYIIQTFVNGNIYGYSIVWKTVTCTSPATVVTGMVVTQFESSTSHIYRSSKKILLAVDYASDSAKWLTKAHAACAPILLGGSNETTNPYLLSALCNITSPSEECFSTIANNAALQSGKKDPVKYFLEKMKPANTPQVLKPTVEQSNTVLSMCANIPQKKHDLPIHSISLLS